MDNNIPNEILKLLSKLPYRIFDNGEDRVLLITAENSDGTISEYAGFMKGYYRPHIHDETDSDITVICGNGTVIINDDRQNYAPGSNFLVPRGTKHGFEVEEDTWLFTHLSGHILNKQSGKADFRYE